jgi:hypothetical protein
MSPADEKPQRYRMVIGIRPLKVRHGKRKQA